MAFYFLLDKKISLTPCYTWLSHLSLSSWSFVLARIGKMKGSGELGFCKHTAKIKVINTPFNVRHMI